MPLEIARVLKNTKTSLKRTIKLCHWNAEHPGMAGSTEYVLDHFRQIEENCCGCLNFENMGHILTQTYWLDRCPELIPVIDEALEDSGFWQQYSGIKYFRKQSPGPISDHNTFYWDVGIPSVEYHWGDQWALGAEDTIEKCDPQKIRYGCRLGLSTLLKIANSLILPYDFSAYSKALQQVLEERIQTRASDIRFKEMFEALRGLHEKGERLKGLRVVIEGKYEEMKKDARHVKEALSAIAAVNGEIRKTCHLLNRKKKGEPLLTSDYGILFQLEEKAKDYFKIREAVQRVGTTNSIDLSSEVERLKSRMKELFIEEDLSKMVQRIAMALNSLEGTISKASDLSR
jgi:hypothetical protein